MTDKRKKLCRALFALYILLMIFLLFIMRADFSGKKPGLFSREHLELSSLTPFKTIREYERHLKNGTISRPLAVVNLLGNLLAFAPLGVFIPMLTKGRLSRFGYFFLFSLGVICCVEITQFVTYTGSLDVDDLILNLAGACGAFLLMKTKPLKKLYS